jgi:hypothetical protein
MDCTITERRRDARLSNGCLDTIKTTLRPGYSVTVVDVSAGGALVQGSRPLRPGANVHLQVVTAGGTFAVAAGVLRCAVWSLGGGDGVLYRGALKFEERCERFSLWERETPDGQFAPGSGSREQAVTGNPLPISDQRKAS